MCALCTMLGIAGDAEAAPEPPEESEGPGVKLTENEDGTVSMTLTRAQLSNMVARLKLSSVLLSL